MSKNIFVTSVLLDILLLLLFRRSELKYKQVLIFPITLINCLIGYYTYLTREKYNFNVLVKTLFRLFKFVLIFITIHAATQAIEIKQTNLIYFSIVFLMAIDLTRAFMYEIVSSELKSRVTNGFFDDILKLEPFFIKIHYPSFNSLSFSLDDFYERGRPTKVDHEYLFDLWNDEAIQTDKILTLYTTDDISLRPEALEISQEARFLNKKFLLNRLTGDKVKSPFKSQQVQEKLKNEIDSLINPVTYEFTDNEATNVIQKEDDCSFEVSTEEVISENEQEEEEPLNEYQKKDQDANLWILINEEVRKAEHIQPKTGRITKKSLQYYFKDKADAVYKILSFNRTEELNFIVFRDNIRQINNERDNLYTAIECNNNLLSKVYYTLIFIESLITYCFASYLLNIQPLLVKLCLPIFILPTFSTIKVIIESFLFIVYTHPYDPGDRIHLDGENYIVRDISLLTTTLIRWDGVTCIICNEIIKDKFITNIRRSLSQTWTLNFLIDSRISDRKMEELQTVLNKLVDEDKSYRNITMYTSEIIDSVYLKLNILVKHRNNFQSGFLMWNNHTKFLRILSEAMAIIGIKYLPMTRNIEMLN